MQAGFHQTCKAVSNLTNPIARGFGCGIYVPGLNNASQQILQACSNETCKAKWFTNQIARDFGCEMHVPALIQASHQILQAGFHKTCKIVSNLTSPIAWGFGCAMYVIVLIRQANKYCKQVSIRLAKLTGPQTTWRGTFAAGCMFLGLTRPASNYCKQVSARVANISMI